ncbi:predicted protein [Naegleria gruberi]|uniref:Predicted protein n=1 Tax=Naegleria gruberi TaxID=5762 RepID=D2V883_NAEGR|nr:uncharacterized protein NAEGRDRAFT_65063 [Naegleria gruberi]EFC46999.1 predicted protein [Naegleria gruberi]|eukprot:XP_002679743.1 predicted protein [Naegleria gruberi strain NEG-M]
MLNNIYALITGNPLPSSDSLQLNNTPEDEEKSNQSCPPSFYEESGIFFKSYDSLEYCKYLYDPNQFVAQFKSCLEEENFTKLRNLRILIQHQTTHICRTRKYNFRPIKVEGEVKKKNVELKEHVLVNASINSKYYRNELLDVSDKVGNPEKDTQVLVFNGDCLDIAFHVQDLLMKEGQLGKERVAVLNMANPEQPGGGYKTGCGAQEENLHRRSNLYQCLDNPVDRIDKKRTWSYPIGYESGVFSPDVTVFRGCEAKGYPLLSAPRLIDVITAAAVPNSAYNDGSIDNRNIGSIEAILKIAVQHKVRNLVLSALGCGAFRNSPTAIAQVFKEKIESTEFKGHFDRVFFAIIDDHNAKKVHNPDGNIKPFVQVFSKYLKEREDLPQLIGQQFDYDYDNMALEYHEFYANL